MDRLKLCKLISLPTPTDNRGKATFIMIGKEAPFKVRRVYYLYNIPKNRTRGGHAHKREKQIVIAVNGKFDVLLDDGIKKKKITLNNPSKALYIAPMVWREFHNFSKNSVLLALVDDLRNENEYIRDYNTFKKATNR